MAMDASSWVNFLLVFVRITTFMVTAPLFSGRQIPAHYKIGFSAALSVLCVGVMKEPVGSVSEATIVLLILKEFLVGIVLGMAANILFYAVQLAGSLIDLQIGFSMANLFDPTFGTNTQLTGRLKNILAILVLLSTNCHHLLIQGILASFDWITLKELVPAWSDGRLSTFLLECLTQMFMLGFMMAAPIIGTLFVVDVALGIIARIVPQMNIFAVMPPIKILLFFLIYIFILPSFFYLLKVLFDNMFESMYSILKIMGG
ncbi:flagellar biosynthetic protein FliR [Bacillus sp. AFS073361]|uniref:flagellar biosynthetic protein FliR n=1 Tax=Bacillus sp. AFS073361 TaxID=2033511 RepID=UPI000BF38EF0|nr:flagellar biosynthetic protein FliR [Bacillus sp. AFS073361]PFP30766.1 flagellar biosynthetic protein FliR [Bacillus sp. AFS073361]